MMGVRSVGIATCLVAALSGCAIAPPPIPIHDDPAVLVAMEYDPHAGAGHSHPAPISQVIITAVLRGLHVQKRDVMGTLGLLGAEHGTPVFTDRALVDNVASYLVGGLAKASPRDLITFYAVQGDGHGLPVITSGGVFRRGDHLYVILANGKISPSGLQYEMAYEPNTRSAPLVPIARLKYTAGFTPAEARVATSEAKRADQWRGYLDESLVVVVDLRRLANSLLLPATGIPAVPPAP